MREWVLHSGHRILGISVEPYFSVFVFAVLVQRQQYDIVLGLYGENGNDGTVDNSAVFSSSSTVISSSS